FLCRGGPGKRFWSAEGAGNRFEQPFGPAEAQRLDALVEHEPEADSGLGVGEAERTVRAPVTEGARPVPTSEVGTAGEEAERVPGACTSSATCASCSGATPIRNSAPSGRAISASKKAPRSRPSMRRTTSPTRFP